MSQRPLSIVPDPASEEANPPSFDEFFAAESQTLYRRMCLVTRDHHEAEEVVQDAFLSLYERWDRVSGVPDPVGYLYRTAFNAWKKRSRRAGRAIRNAVTPQPAPDEFEAADDRTVVGEALGHLTPRQRAAIVLTELMGLSSEDAGQILGIRAVTARVLASQARAALRERLGDLHA
jgi:RNA polymerase sigma factor (sigma-70 family)